MDRIRVPKVENVVCWRQGKSVKGNIHLTPHHIIFRYPHPQASETPEAKEPQHRETWIAYPMIYLCAYRPSPHASHQPPSIRLRSRDFNFIAFHFDTDQQARGVFDSIKALTSKLGHIEKLYAYSYPSNSAEKAIKGWDIYDPRKELRRQGISDKSADKGWRITNINSNYEYSPTYPAVLVVPSIISDNVLKHTASYRSRARIPALTYIHPVNNCTITRSAQPVVGVMNARSPQDEKLVAAIFETTKASLKPNRSAPATPQNNGSTSDLSSMVKDDSTESETPTLGNISLEGSADTISNSQASATSDDTAALKVYGAQQNNMIVDARPYVNAYAMRVAGYGSENMAYYPTARKEYLSIDNIHVMRRSLEEVFEAFKDSDLTSFPPNREKLANSKWLKHINGILDGTSQIVTTVAINHSHVLIHCSDGWDRTSQLSALSQLCLDPYFRTIEGFIVLVEKDWLSFGYMFRLRGALLSHDKWFEVENERISATRAGATNGGSSVDAQDSGNAFENALASAKGLLNFRKKNENNTSDVESEGDIKSLESSPAATKRITTAAASKEHTMETLLKETSPVFHQFLDATYQLLRQHPTRFEFNERFLRRLLYHLYSCQYGTFLYNNEKERMQHKAKERTHSVWDYFLAKRAQFLNDKYDSTIDDLVLGKERLVLPRRDDVRWWAELFGRTDAEMNSPPPGAPVASDSLDGSINGSGDNAYDSNAFGTVSSSTSSVTGSTSTDRFARMEERPAPVSASQVNNVRVTLANVGLESVNAVTQNRWTSGTNGKTTNEEMEVELQ